jgi:hypothetical protein
MRSKTNLICNPTAGQAGMQRLFSETDGTIPLLAREMGLFSGTLLCSVVGWSIGTIYNGAAALRQH